LQVSGMLGQVKLTGHLPVEEVSPAANLKFAFSNSW